MKKITLFLFALFTCWQINAQVSSYGFSQSAGTYTEISGGTALGVATNDDTSFNAISIGFNFVYNGGTYNQISVNSNGFLAMGATVASSTSALSAGTTNNVIAALNGDLQGNVTTGELSYQLSGAAPNQVLTVQWKNYRHYDATGDLNNFQIKLYETTNAVEVVYGAFTQNATNRTRQVGLRGSAATDFNNRTTTTDWSATTAGGTNAANCKLATAIKPLTGQKFTWSPPSCVAPGGFVASAITSTTATISWSAATPAPSNGYQYYYSDVNTAPTTPSASVAGLTANLAALNSATTYYVWLRTDCGGTFSAWNGPFTFVTNCVSVTSFIQDFESTTGALLPTCWAKVGASGTTNTQASTEISGARNLYIYSSSAASRPVVSMTPVSNANAGTHRMRMKVRGNFSAGETIELGYLTNPADATTFVAINSIVTNSTSAPQNFVTVPSGMPAGDVVFALRTGTALLSVLVDDVTWEPIPAIAPTCSTILSPTDGVIDTTNSTVTWSSSTDATGYYLNVGYSTGDTSLFNLQDVGNVLSYPIPTDPGTTYYVTVIPYNAFGQATGCTEVSFTTCDVLMAPFLEQFTTFLPSCWQAADNGNLLAGPATFGASSWVADGFGNVGSNGAISFNIDFTGDNDWIISPIVKVPATGYELKFDAAATQWNTTVAPTTPWEADDFIQVLISSTGTSNWTVLHTYDNTNQPTNTGTALVLDLDAYAGQEVRFAIRAVEGAVNGSADIDFSIDNFEVRLTPSSIPICATNIVATPNATCGNFASTITWDAVAGADGYNITVGATSGGATIANNVNLGNTTTYSFVGNAGTTYYYTIVPFNAAGPAVGCTENSFSTVATGCYCPSTPTSVDGVGIINVQIVATNFANTVSTSPVYNNFTATAVDMSQGINNNVQISFDTDFGYAYNTVIWIDANDNFTFEPSEIVYTGVSIDDPTTILNASFVLPLSTPLGQHRMRIVATYNEQLPSNPCYSGVYGETADFTINVIAATCTPGSVASSTVVPSCATAQFSVNVNVTALGGGTPSITDGTSSWPVTATGIVNVGPFAVGTSVTLTLLHGADATCNLPLGTFTYLCPPANNNCANAQVLTPGGVFATNSVVGTNVGATDSGETAPGCGGYSGGDVWYRVTVPASGNITIESNRNPSGLINDTALAVYSGSCGSLVLVECDDDDSADGLFSLVALTGRTPGEVLYVRVWEYGNDTFGTFQVSAYDASLSASSFDTNSFLAYPNPVKDVFNLSYTSEISSVRVLNLLGQEVVSKAVNANSTQIDMSQLSAGTYIVNVTVGDAVKSIKVIKQ